MCDCGSTFPVFWGMWSDDSSPPSMKTVKFRNVTLALKMFSELWPTRWGGDPSCQGEVWWMAVTLLRLEGGDNLWDDIIKWLCSTVPHKSFSIWWYVYLLPMPKQLKHQTPLCVLTTSKWKVLRTEQSRATEHRWNGRTHVTDSRLHPTTESRSIQQSRRYSSHQAAWTDLS